MCKMVMNLMSRSWTYQTETMELTWGTNVISSTDPWRFACEQSETLNLAKMWNQDIAERLVDSLTDEHNLDKVMSFQTVARILRFSNGSVLSDLDKYGLLGVILCEYTYNQPKIAQYILEIFVYYTCGMPSAVEEMIEYDMMWVIYDIMDQPLHYQEWELMCQGLQVLRNIADTEMKYYLVQKWQMKHDAERPLYNILLPALKEIATNPDETEKVVEMVIDFAACIKSMIIHDDPQNDDDRECIKNLGNILLMCGIIPNYQIWCNISDTLPAIITNNSVNDVCTSIKPKILKPLYRDWHVSLKVQVIDGWHQWIIQEKNLNHKIFVEMIEPLVNHISPTDELVESMISLFNTITKIHPGQLTIEIIIKVAIECQNTPKVQQLYLIIASVIGTSYL